MAIHPTAIVSPKAELDSSVEVGPHAIIEEHVKIGNGTKVWANAYITGHTTIGRDNQIHMGAVIGHEPQDLKFDRMCRSYLRIGDRNVFREYCSVHRGTEPDSATVIGDDCLLMGQSHVAHNCVIGNGVIICNGALVAGHAHIGDRAFLSGCVLIHQFTHVGRLVMFQGGAGVSMDVPPFTLAANVNEVRALNLVGLRRAKITREAISELKALFQLFYLSGKTGSQALAESSGKFHTPEAQEFIAFVKQSPNGICPGPQRRALAG